MQFELDGLHIRYERRPSAAPGTKEDRVSGCARFPAECHGLRSIPIAFFNRPPLPLGEGSGVRAIRDDPHASAASSLDAKARQRLEIVQEFRGIRSDCSPRESDRNIHQHLAQKHGVSPSSVRVWVGKYETGGVEALQDNYVQTPRKVLSLDEQTEKDAVLIAAWWAMRIGQLDCIDHKALHSALLCLAGGSSASASSPSPCQGEGRGGVPVNDVLATIDCYYSYPRSDPAKFPFKPFHRWAKHDFQKWLYRACADLDWHDAVARFYEQEKVQLRRPAVRQDLPAMPDLHTRQRDTRNRGTRRAIASLVRPPSPSQGEGRGEGASSIPRSLDPPIPSPEQMQLSNTLRKMGNTAGARDVITRHSQIVPTNLTEFLQAIDGAHRDRLLAASKGDRTAFDEALATMPLWWEKLPATHQRGLHGLVSDIGATGPGAPGPASAPPPAQARRKALTMLLASLKRAAPPRPLAHQFGAAI